ncbi:MAG TPA: hypothetical protein P5531_11955 [Bacteroidales bacterium]|nr:hypothetical protein [Bacteroidales bacterium]HSA44327.1 hypothetical protein [Bacteroidales bacterium]
MKKIMFCCLSAAWVFPCSASTWYPYGPSGIASNNVCFNIDNQGHTVICTDYGLYITQVDGSNPNFYTYGLPVLAAEYDDGNDFILIQGEGTWSDGIYRFSPSLQQFSVIEWCVYPHFLLYDHQTNQYFAGHQSGILTSADGASWTSLPFFTGKDCKAMAIDFTGNYAVAFADTGSHCMAVSSDSGLSWSFSVNAPPLCDLWFDMNGVLYGVFPGTSNSSGLWKSTDQGMNWNNVLFSDHMTSVGIDMMNHVFMGWNDPSGISAGVGLLDPVNLISIPCNNGLTDLHISKFKINPILSSIKIFCCTADGVFIMDSGIVGLDGNENPESVTHIFPNPAKESCCIQLDQAGKEGKLLLSIFDTKGTLVRKPELVKINPAEQRIPVDVSGLSPGSYFFGLQTANCRKSIMLVKE